MEKATGIFTPHRDSVPEGFPFPFTRQENVSYAHILRMLFRPGHIVF
jgi:hypothetical protein